MTLSDLKRQLAVVRAEENYSLCAKECRKLLLDAITYIYEKNGEIVPKSAKLLDMIDGRVILHYIGEEDDELLQSLHFIRIIGANAEHGEDVRKKDAKLALENIVYFIDYIESEERGEPQRPAKTSSFTEAETRHLYIDLYLREAGWKVLEEENVALPTTAGVEIRVEGMPNNSQEGFCDYVLYGRDGNPLAIVEAKKTSVDADKGKAQVKLYADCMERKYGYRPIQYYTNGYQTRIIDEIYADNRKLMAFHTIQDLELLIKRRSRPQITDMQVDPQITDRAYQQMAITKVCERLNSKRRRALLVMATGTGKTRVAASLVDVLSREKNGWVKNVLFLADRITLVHQAKQAFEKFLPNMTICELSAKGGERDYDARLMFCTYQTMIEYIDAEDKRFSTGRFDLIITDESHRSIFNRYGAIFKYFDSFLVGLTATPKREVGPNTYRIFDCEQDEPTYAYSMEEAIHDAYLVGYEVYNKSSSILKEGIKYKDLTDEQKEQFDEYFDDEDPDDETVISGGKIFKELYNEDTCKKVLQDLMTTGIRTDDGEFIGKTIIFAYNHRHAQMIVDCFKELYTENVTDDTCQLVDYSVNYAQDLVEKFKANPEFRIAVSVDMLDTGVDVPEVVNLVFFKPVRSRIKFIQMIGRGTRTCEDLFGPGRNKQKFLIYDYCGVFEYFDEHPDGSPGSEVYSLSQRLFDTKLDLLIVLQRIDYQLDPVYRAYYDEVKNDLISEVVKIKGHSKRIQVREQMSYVDKYVDINTWVSLSQTEVKEIKKHITPLIDGGLKGTPETVSFDICMYRIQKSILNIHSVAEAASDVKRVRMICKFLINKRSSVSQVINKAELLMKLMGEPYWDDAKALEVEENRKQIRDLMPLTRVENKKIPIDIPDLITDSDKQIEGTSYDIRTYTEKVIDYLAENSDNPVITKIYNLEPLTNDDMEQLEKILWNELGTEEDYQKATHIQNLAAFVRSLKGINQTVVNQKFGEYISGTQFNSRQQEFIKLIIEYVRQNGDIELAVIVNAEPFISFGVTETFGERIDIVKRVVSTLHDCIAVA
ncbi:type I restriction enzyme, R subunit [Lachnospiraceae bacterium XBB2008]|nr:type I restriction enzyme, R subunit [Lachnospiraceae bacterium XBB2008]